jgi:hypothetical protein
MVASPDRFTVSRCFRSTRCLPKDFRQTVCKSPSDRTTFSNRSQIDSKNFTDKNQPDFRLKKHPVRSIRILLPCGSYPAPGGRLYHNQQSLRERAITGKKTIAVTRSRLRPVGNQYSFRAEVTTGA